MAKRDMPQPRPQIQQHSPQGYVPTLHEAFLAPAICLPSPGQAPWALSEPAPASELGGAEGLKGAHTTHYTDTTAEPGLINQWWTSRHPVSLTFETGVPTIVSCIHS